MMPSYTDMPPPTAKMRTPTIKSKNTTRVRDQTDDPNRAALRLFRTPSNINQPLPVSTTE
jgi:hypothetical protein